MCAASSPTPAAPSSSSEQDRARDATASAVARWAAWIPRAAVVGAGPEQVLRLISVAVATRICQFIDSPRTFVHSVDPRVNLVWLLALVVLPARSNIYMRIGLVAHLSLLSMWVLPNRVWKIWPSSPRLTCHHSNKTRRRRRSCPIPRRSFVAGRPRLLLCRMASRCAARLPPPPCASRCGWASSRVSVRPARYGASRGRAVVCAVSFRPCIDIHKGKVKQIVGSTLRDSSDDGTALVTNFESDKSPTEYANLYKEDKLGGGHVIMLGADPASQAAALEALRAYPGGLQLGGGINLENAISYLNEGASHVIVTSYAFSEGKMNIERLRQLVDLVGKQRLVLDLSCRKKDGRYAIVTDRWQKFSDVFVDEPTIEYLAVYADEFLVHGVDLEGKRLGIDEELVALLGRHSPIPVTYAGGVSTMDDLERIKKAGKSRVDVTVGSALDIFGGDLPYKDVVLWHKEQNMVGQP